MQSRQRFLEFGRRIYGELVRGRARVRVVTEAPDRASSTPRFVLAPYRSGTTLLRYCLDSHPDAAVPPETDFLVPLSSVLDDGASVTGLSDLGYQRSDVGEKLGTFARQFYDTYAQGRGVANWIDKSPRYAERPFRLLDLFPDARFVVMHRHPLDQIQSFTRGGTFEHSTLGNIRSESSSQNSRELIIAAAVYWRDVMTGLYKLAAGHPEQTLVVGYERLCERPRQVLSEVLSHFDLEWSDRVLEYHRYGHDLGREAGRVAGTKGFSMSAGAWRTWPADWIEAAWDTCRDMADTLGYTLRGDGRATYT